jgi:hypothetical protein
VDTRFDQPVAYGPRVPFMALGTFALANHVSHVPLELSSVTAFIEWNWLGGLSGQLHRRDAIVSNIGSLLDPGKTLVPVPVGPQPPLPAGSAPPPPPSGP